MILLMTTMLPEKSPWGMAGKLAPLGLAYIAAALEKKGFEVRKQLIRGSEFFLRLLPAF